MSRRAIATELARRTAGKRATESMVDAMSRNDELMAIAREDMDTAVQMIVEPAIASIFAHVPILLDKVEAQRAKTAA